jgi:hypothetical protein
MQRVQLPVIAVDHDDRNRIEVHHRPELDNQRLQNIGKIQVRTDGLRNTEDGLRSSIVRTLLRSGRIHLHRVAKIGVLGKISAEPKNKSGSVPDLLPYLNVSAGISFDSIFIFADSSMWTGIP